MTAQFPKWPPEPSSPWPETQHASNGETPDFPGSAGDREQGKFRPSDTPRLTVVAVVNDDGTRIGSALVPGYEELSYWIRALYAGLVAGGVAQDVTEGLLFEGL